MSESDSATGKKKAAPSRVISASGGERFQRWTKPEMVASVTPAKEQGRGYPATSKAVDLDELKRQAYQEGFSRGKADGEAAVQQALQQQGASLSAIMASLSEPLKQLDERLETSLFELAIAVARQIVRREIKVDPGQVVAVVKEAIAVLPMNLQQLRLYLHPEDADTIRKVFSFSEEKQSWEVIEDPLMSRGGCRIETESSQVDATIESRVAAIATKVMGGERDNDRD